MSDIFGKVCSIFLAVTILFGMPLVYMQERAKTAEQLFLITEATHFVDSVCNTGKIDRHSLRRFRRGACFGKRRNACFRQNRQVV